MPFRPLVSKARKPKFHLHLKICDLNNVPLISGVSMVKWHLPHSLHGEHRGRTAKCPIANHRVEYGYAKIVPLRIVIDRAGCLTECPIEFEVLQEFSNPGPGGAGLREEKVTLGVVRLNLSEYVDESEALLRPSAAAAAARQGRRPSFGEPLGKPGAGGGHARQRSSLSGVGSTSTAGGGGGGDAGSGRAGADDASSATTGPEVEDGVVRRYLMQDSKINSTLKISILMVQVDGDRNYVAPPLKSAPVFGGIAGILPPEPLEPFAHFTGDGAGGGGGVAGSAGARIPSFSKSRDAYELQDMYRRALAASWASQPDELPADECVEDIFAGGDGFRSGDRANGGASSHPAGAAGGSGSGSGSSMPATGPRADVVHAENHPSGPAPSTRPSAAAPGLGGRSSSGSSSHGGTSDPDEDDRMGTLRPRDLARMRDHGRSFRGAGERGITETAFPLFKDPQGGAGGGAPSGSRGASAAAGYGPGLAGPVPVSVAAHTHAHSSSSSSSSSPYHRRHASGDGGSVGRSRSGSNPASLATTLGSERAGDGFKRPKEVDEDEVREDMVAWSLPATSVSS